MATNRCDMCCKVEFSEDTRAYEIRDKDSGSEFLVCKDCKEKWEQDQVYRRVQPHVEALCRELNGGDKKRIAQAFLDAFNCEHRYLQSSFFLTLMEFFRAYGTQDEARWFDGRNLHCRKLAKKWYQGL